MNRLILILALFTALPAVADTFSFTIGWNPFPDPDVSMKTNCRVNDGAEARVGTVPGTETSVSGTTEIFGREVNHNDIIHCRVWVTKNGAKIGEAFISHTYQSWNPQSLTFTVQ